MAPRKNSRTRIYTAPRIAAGSRHGGRRARARGKPKVAADFVLLAAAVNLTRLGALGLYQDGTWTATPPESPNSPTRSPEPSRSPSAAPQSHPPGPTRSGTAQTASYGITCTPASERHYLVEALGDL